MAPDFKRIPVFTLTFSAICDIPLECWVVLNELLTRERSTHHPSSHPHIHGGGQNVANAQCTCGRHEHKHILSDFTPTRSSACVPLREGEVAASSGVQFLRMPRNSKGIVVRPATTTIPGLGENADSAVQQK